MVVYGCSRCGLVCFFYVLLVGYLGSQVSWLYLSRIDRFTYRMWYEFGEGMCVWHCCAIFDAEKNELIETFLQLVLRTFFFFFGTNTRNTLLLLSPRFHFSLKRQEDAQEYNKVQLP